MGDDDTGDAERTHGIVDAAFAVGIEVAGGFVKQQHLRPAIERTGQQDALLLPARQHRPHVADERGIAHRHRGDVLVHGRGARAGLHPFGVRLRIEERDVRGDAAGEQRIVLHHAGDGGAVAIQPDLVQRAATAGEAARGRAQQAEHQLDQRGLAAARGTDEGHRFADLDVQADVVQHVALARRPAEAHPVEPQFAERGHVGRRRLRRGRGRAWLGCTGQHVGDAVGVQAEQAQVQQLVGQRGGALHELGLVGQEGHQHADAETVAVEHQQRAQADAGRCFQPQQQALGALQGQRQALCTQAGIDLRLQPRVELVGAARLGIEQLDALHAAYRLQEVALLARLQHQLLLHRLALAPVHQHAHGRLTGHRGQCQQRQRGAVDDHHRQRQQRQRTVDHRFGRAGGQAVLQVLQRLQPRGHVAQPALFEPRHRQREQVAEQPRRHLLPQPRAQLRQQPAAQRGRHHLQQHDPRERRCQHEHQLLVLAVQRAVHGPLHLQRQHQRPQLQQQRQAQHAQCAAGMRAQIAGHGTQRQWPLQAQRHEVRPRRQLQRHAAEVPGQLVEAEAAPSHRRVQQLHPRAAHLRQHDEVVVVPVQHAGQAQAGQVGLPQLQRARLQRQLLGDAQQVGQRRAAQ